MSARWSTRCGIFGLFGGHEVDRAHVHPALGQACSGGLAEGIGGVDEPGQAKVENADRSRGVEHEVSGLDVAVYDPLGVSRFEAAGGLHQAIDGLGDGHWSTLSHDAIEVTARDEIHHQEMDAPVFVGVDGGDDVGML